MSLPKNASQQVPVWRINGWTLPQNRIPWRANQRRLDRIMETLWGRRSELDSEEDIAREDVC